MLHSPYLFVSIFVFSSSSAFPTFSLSSKCSVLSSFHSVCLRSFFLSFCPSFILSSPRAHLHVVGMLRFMSDRNQQSLPTPFYSILASISVFMDLSSVFHSINSPDNAPLSHSVLLVLFLPYWYFQLHVSS